MNPTHAVAERRARARRTPKRPDPGGQAASANVEVSIQHLDRIAIRAPEEDRAAAMLDAALAEPAQALPYASTLEQRFAQPLDWVRVRRGPLAGEALDALGARAATRGANVFLREGPAPLEVVAHEVTHALQARRGGAGGTGGRVVDEHAAAELEAAPAAEPDPALRAPVRPAEGLAPGAIALLRQGPLPSADPTITVEPDAAAASIAGPSIAGPSRGTEPTDVETSTAASAAVPAASRSAPAPGSTADAGEAFALPSLPESERVAGGVGGSGGGNGRGRGRAGRRGQRRRPAARLC